jgi:hypothetical protein
MSIPVAEHKLVPKGHADLRKAIGMCTNDGNIPRMRIRVINWYVLLDSKLQDIFLFESRSTSVFANMLGWDDMFLDMERFGGHDGV